MELLVLYRPALHGALGYWDEVINLVPVVVGVVLLIYLYRSSRRHRADDEAPTEQEGPPPV